MITLITGLPGSGKSLFTLKTVKDLADQENRPVFYHGIPELTLDWHKMDKGEDWVDCPKGAIIVIDECQTTFRPRANGAAVPKHVSQLEVHRHDGHDLFLITQHPMLLDGNLRRLVGRHYHVVRFYGFQKSTIHEFQSVRENVKSLKGSIEKHFVYPKEVFGWYKSADMHTMKRRIPARLVLVVLLPIVFIAVIWFLISTIGGFSDRHGTEPGKEDGSLLNQPVQQYQPVPTPIKPELTWIEARQERVPGIPYSAPVYDKITEPVTAPVIAACVDFRGQCKCYSQQATPIQTDESLCRQIIRSGVFVDFDPGQSVTERAQQAERDRITAERQRSEEARQRMLDREESERDRQAQQPVQAVQSQPAEQQPIQPSVIQRQRMQESQWAFPNT
ncbi:Zonular occludens toxin [Methylobacillus flagellatus]|uniref:zonular occludens toxin domain-containing protein n=1 Tax=Methylobacillus flagellatus TaxID=405 RepID=UPI002853B2B7|nr:zonular occludens toxin domain-containing protein [Methylobacillus flagellatus]MDR5172277.1 Zonular occludens toxin [Methylobacillus flagellatus]